MREIFACMCTFPIFCSAAIGQSNDMNVAYVKNVPVVVRSRMPRHAQTSFYGITNLKAYRGKLAIHLYSYLSKKTAKDQYDYVSPPDMTRRYAAELFEVSAASGRKGIRTFRKISSTPSWQDFDSQGPVKVSQLWLDPKKKSIPVLKLDCMYEGHGTNHNYALLIFNRGLQKSPVVARYRDYADFYEGEGVTFDKVDERGYMVVTVSLSIPERQPVYTDLYWSGSGFAKRNDPAPTAGAHGTGQRTGAKISSSPLPAAPSLPLAKQP